MISLNGAAARKAVVGDLVIVAAYAEVEEHELEDFKPRLIYVGGDNRIRDRRATVPLQEIQKGA